MTTTVVPTATEDRPEQRSRFGTLGSIVGILLLTWAAAVASFPINDNSFLTHLATGRLILDEGAVPTSDPYTFTASGEPWTVQSWLASLVYASAEALAGDVGLRLVVLVTFAAAAGVVWRLIEPAASIVVRVLLLGFGIVVFTELWSERPYMVGVIGLGLVWLALEGRVPPWSLVPYLWLWVNWHGSFVLGLLLYACLVAGAVVDRRVAGEPVKLVERERHVGAALVIGTLAGAVGPLGPRILLFPTTTLTKSEAFSEVIEWQPPSYRSLAEVSFLVLFVVTTALLARRASWRLAIPVLVFGAAGLYAQRNVVMATLVLLAAGAHLAPAVGSLQAGTRPRVGKLMAAAATTLLIAVTGITLATPALPESSLGAYPARALAWMSSEPATGRLAAPMSVGNLLEALDGPTGKVFIDDRVDMFPAGVLEDALTIGRGGPGWAEALERHEITSIVWERSAPIASLLASDPGWKVVYADAEWVYAVRRNPNAG